MSCVTMRGHAWPDTTTNIALRYNTNLAMLDKIWPCSARHFGAVRVLSRAVACCQGAVKNGLSMTMRAQRKITETLTRSATVPVGKKQVILWDAR